MKLSEQWLREWVQPQLTRQGLINQLTMAGLEVGGCEPVIVAGASTEADSSAPMLCQVVVGRITALKSHPQQSNLSICTVNVGATEKTIVCGATNVRIAMNVAVALPGARLPELGIIQPIDKKGVLSEGMLCSATELGLTSAHEDSSATPSNPIETAEPNVPTAGILELPPEATPGQDLITLLQLDDAIIDIELTPNRGDCFSVLGVAREVAAIERIELNDQCSEPQSGTFPCPVSVNVIATSACPRYLGRTITGLSPNRPTPLWLQERLRRSGIRSISLLVDITNYVMIELGQPLHAFDLNKLDGQISVRFAKLNEPLTLLNAAEVQLTPDTLVIADNSGPVAIAGVMGGLRTSVDSATTDIFLEAAFFAPVAIAGVARRYGLVTDSSMRFERGVDPNLPQRALTRATELLLTLAGGACSTVMDITDASALPQRLDIILRHAQIKRILGVELSVEEVSAAFQASHFTATPIPDGWRVQVPSYRFDMALEVDVIEELARLIGYNNLPAQMLRTELRFVPAPQYEISLAQVRHILLTRGYHEAITYSFVSAAVEQSLSTGNDPIRLRNPISPELSVMRTSLWAGLIQALQYNLNRQAERVRLFETGLRYQRAQVESTDLPVQALMLAGLAYGPHLPLQWSEASRWIDFYDIKNDVCEILQLTHDFSAFSFRVGTHPALHPGQSATLWRENTPVGHVGVLHPKIAQEFALEQPVVLFECALAPLLRAKPLQAQSISKFPLIRRDLAFVVDRDIAIADILNATQLAAGPMLLDVQLFDVYQGASIATTQQSVAIRLTFSDVAKTLVDQEVNTAIENVISSIVQQFSATLRE